MQTPPSNPGAPPVSPEAGVVADQTWLLRAILEELVELNALVRAAQCDSRAELMSAAS